MTGQAAHAGRPQGVADAADAVASAALAHAVAADRDASFPVEALTAMRRSGLLGLLVPPEYGGLGGWLDELIDATLRIGRADASAAMIFTMHCQQVAAIVRHGSERLRGELLADIAAGRLYLGSVTTDAASGGQLLTANSESLAGGDDTVTISRFAPIVTGGDQADGFLITVRTPQARSATEVSLIYASRDQLKIRPAGGWDPLGMRATNSIPLQLDGTLPAHQIIGRPGDFGTIVTSIFGPIAHLGWAACWLGTAAGALSRVLRMLRDPATRRSASLDSELLLSRLSRARQRLDTVHALIRHATRMMSESPDFTQPSVQLLLNSVKLTASEECCRAVDELIEAVGMRHGYLRDSPTRLEQALRDLRSATLNFSNDRLHLADGKLCMLDTEVRFA